MLSPEGDGQPWRLSTRKISMSNARRILVVGDDPVERASFGKVLAEKGHAVVTAESGEEAVWQLGNERYDAVVTSMTLRGITGLEVAEEIHASQPWLPFVIITGQGSEDAQARAATVGVTEVLRRPLTPGQLAAATDRVLQSAQSVAAMRPEASVAGAAPRQAMISFALRVRDIVLFLLAPFIGLVYLLTLPIVGLGALAWFAFKPREPAPAKAAPARPAAVAGPGMLRTIGMMFAVGISGVAYAVFAPLLGIGLILWAGFQAWGRLGARAMKA
jgi:CheY-like chemotaxis protein